MVFVNGRKADHKVTLIEGVDTVMMRYGGVVVTANTINQVDIAGGGGVNARRVNKVIAADGTEEKRAGVRVGDGGIGSLGSLYCADVTSEGGIGSVGRGSKASTINGKPVDHYLSDLTGGQRR